MFLKFENDLISAHKDFGPTQCKPFLIILEILSLINSKTFKCIFTAVSEHGMEAWLTDFRPTGSG